MNNLNIFLLFLCLIYFKLTEDKKGDLRIIIGALSLYLLYRVLTDAEGLEPGDCVNNSTFYPGRAASPREEASCTSTLVADPHTVAENDTDNCTLTSGSCVAADDGVATCAYVAPVPAVASSPPQCRIGGNACGQGQGDYGVATATCAECTLGGGDYTTGVGAEDCPENEVCSDSKCECSPSPDFCGMWQDLNTDKDNCTAYVSGVDYTCTIDNCCDNNWLHIFLAILAIILIIGGIFGLFTEKKNYGVGAIVVGMVVGCILGGMILIG